MRLADLLATLAQNGQQFIILIVNSIRSCGFPCCCRCSSVPSSNPQPISIKLTLFSLKQPLWPTLFKFVYLCLLYVYLHINLILFFTPYIMPGAHWEPSVECGLGKGIASQQPADRSMVVGQFLAPFSVPLTEAILPTSRVAPERSGEQQLHPERGGKCEPRYSSRWLLITYAVSASGMGNEWLIFHMMQQNDQYLFRLNVYPGGGGAEVRTLLVSHRHDCTEMRWDHRHPVRQSMGE